MPSTVNSPIIWSDTIKPIFVVAVLLFRVNNPLATPLATAGVP